MCTIKYKHIARINLIISVYIIKTTITLRLVVGKDFHNRDPTTVSSEVALAVLSSSLTEKSEAQVREVKSLVEDPTAYGC